MIGTRTVQRNCPGEFRPVLLRDGTGAGLKCDLCNYIHKGGLGAPGPVASWRPPRGLLLFLQSQLGYHTGISRPLG